MDAHSLTFEFTRTSEATNPYAPIDGPREYILRVDGRLIGTFRVPWGAPEINELRLRERSRQVMQKVGDKLSRLLQSAAWTQIASTLEARHRAGSRITIDILSHAAELYTLPWELLSLPSSGQPIGEIEHVLVRYRWPDATVVKEHSRTEGGRVLFAWSGSLGRVSDRHREEIAQAWRDGHVDFDPTTDELANASLATLETTLAAARDAGKPFAVLHLLAHGGRENSTFGLMLDQKTGAGVAMVDGARLRQVLAPHFDTLRLVTLAACNGGNNGALGDHLAGPGLTLHRAGAEAVIASRELLSSRASITLTRELYRGLLVEPCSVEDAFIAARTRLACEDTENNFDWASLQLYAHSRPGQESRPVVFRPYRGPLTFQAEHARFFVGRDTEIDDAVTRINGFIAAAQPRLLILVGASGVGKSSLVHAGVVPRLLQGGKLKAQVVRPSDAVVLPSGVEGERALLVVDQLEELFTGHGARADPSTYLRELWTRATDKKAGTIVLATLRVDALNFAGGRVIDEEGGRTLEALITDTKHGLFVHHLGAQQLGQAIAEPARRVGLSFEAGLVEGLIKDARKEPGAVPMLEIVLDRIWRKRDGTTLREHAYEGGLGQALSTLAEECLQGLEPPAKHQAKRILVRIATGDDVALTSWRRRASAEQLRPTHAERRKAFDVGLDSLIAARLIVADRDAATDDIVTLELAHDLLLQKWSKLQEWIREEGPRLQVIRKLAGWVKESQTRPRMRLTRDQLAIVAEAKLADNDDDYDASMRLIVEVSWRWLKMQQALVIVGVLLVVGLAIFAFKQRDEARDAQQKAENATTVAQTATTVAQTATLMAGAGELLENGQPGPASHLLARVEQPEDERRWGALAARTLAHGIPMFTLAHRSKIDIAHWSPNGDQILTVPLNRNTVWIWRGDGIGEPSLLVGHSDTIETASWSSDGKRILTGSADGTARIWRADGKGKPIVLRCGECRLRGPTWSRDDRFILAESEYPDSVLVWGDLERGSEPLLWDEDARLGAFDRSGTRVLTVSTTSNVVRVWSLDDVREAVELTGGHSDRVMFARWHPDGGRILTASGDGTIGLWRPDATEPLHIVPKHVLDIDWSPNGDHFVTVSDLRYSDRQLSPPKITIWAADASKHTELAGQFDFMSLPVWSPDSTRLLTVSERNEVQVWGTGGTQLASFPAVPGGFSQVSWSPDSERILTLSPTDEGQVWDAPRTDAQAADMQLQRMTLRGGKGEWSPDGGTRILTISDAPNVRVWNREQLGLGVVLTRHRDRVISASWSPDGDHVLSVSEHGALQIHDRDGNEASIAPRGQRSETFYGAAWSPNSEQIVTLSADHLRLWTANGEYLRGIEIDGPNSLGPSPVAWSSEAERIMTVADTVKIHDVALDGSDELVEFAVKGASAFAASFSLDGKRVLATFTDHSVWVFTLDGSSGAEPIIIETGDPMVWPAMWSPDGKSILLATADGGVRVKNSDGSGEAVVVGREKGWVYSATWGDNSADVLTGGADGIARIWNFPSVGLPLVALQGHDGRINSASFSPEGKHVATASDDKTARIWRADGSGEPLIFKANVAFDSIVWSSDGSRVLTTAGDNTVRVWLVESTAMQAALRDANQDCVMPKQRELYLLESPSLARENYQACERARGRARFGADVMVKPLRWLGKPVENEEPAAADSDGIARCYEAALIVEDKQAGELTFSFEVGQDGKVRAPVFDEQRSTIDIEPLRDCVLDLIARWELPAPLEPQRFDASYALDWR